MDKAGNTIGGKYHYTVDLLFDWFGISCAKADNFCLYLQNRLIQTSQTGGQQYSDTSPFSIPWVKIFKGTGAGYIVTLKVIAVKLVLSRFSQNSKLMK
jgi:hypothetical protein